MDENWSTMDENAVISKLRTSLQGLGIDEAELRLETHGPNKLVEPPSTSELTKFIHQFMDPLVFLLITAALISLFVVHKIGDGVFIFIVITMNAVFGYWQERQAEKAMDALKKMSADTAVAIRGDNEVVVESQNLVEGDLVMLHDGDNIPADVRILTSYQFSTDESSLTGESEPRHKRGDVLSEVGGLAEQKNMAFMGTIATSGRSMAVVVATGMKTELGKIADHVVSVQTPKTPLEKKLGSLGKFLGGVALCVAVLLLSLQLLSSYLDGEFTAEGGGYLWDNVRDVTVEQFTVALAIFVAIVPEGLPIILVITLGLGMRNMSRHKAIIRKMNAVETLGSTTVICSDKTGTLTRNQMTVTKFYIPGYRYDVDARGYDPTFGGIRTKDDPEPADPEKLSEDLGHRLAFTCTSLCHNSHINLGEDGWNSIGDSTDAACATFGWKMMGSYEEYAVANPRIHEFFFDTDRKRMTTINKWEGEKWAFTKGAFSQLIDLCTHIVKDGEIVAITEKDVKLANSVNRHMASNALRVLALSARKLGEDFDYSTAAEVENDLIFLGLVGIRDPPRKEAYEAIAVCHEAGIRVIMITGDQAYTAQAVAIELEICGEGGRVVSGSELDELDAELHEIVRDVDVFCRVTPEQKMRIVGALQIQNHVVAMTGDGVNDAPALAAADIGIAMGIAGTDVARDAADMVLQDDNFANIVHAIEEGRKIYQNIRNFVRYQVSTNVAAVLLIILSTFVFGWNLPLTATQILVINILMDGPPAVALGMEKHRGDAMAEPPRPVTEGLPNLIDTGMIAFLGLVMAVGSLVVYRTVLQETSAAEAITATFAVFVMFQLFNVMNCRSLDKSILQLGFASNKAVAISLVVSFGLLFATINFSEFIIPWTSMQLGELLSVAPFSQNSTWLVLMLVASTVFLIEEFRKVLMKNSKLLRTY